MKNGFIKDNWKCMSDVAEYQSGAENSPMELALWINPGSSVVKVYSKWTLLMEQVQVRQGVVAGAFHAHPSVDSHGLGTDR